eukprot:Gb_17985 [translate_table: standard]
MAITQSFQIISGCRSMEFVSLTDQSWRLSIAAPSWQPVIFSMQRLLPRVAQGLINVFYILCTRSSQVKNNLPLIILLNW